MNNITSKIKCKLSNYTRKNHMTMINMKSDYFALPGLKQFVVFPLRYSQPLRFLIFDILHEYHHYSTYLTFFLYRNKEKEII